MSVLFHPDVNKVDIPELPPMSQLEAVRALKALRDNHSCPIGYRVDELFKTHFVLDLTGCKALKITGVSYESALRIVFVEKGADVEVIAVGARTGSLVYRVAQNRLRPPKTRRRMRNHNPLEKEAA